MFRYRAIRKKYYSEDSMWYLFRISDCPALLWKDTFFLAGKPESPILRYDTIVRGLPTVDLFEGDYIYDKNTRDLLGIAVYCNGFYIQELHSSRKKSIPFAHIYVKKGDADSIEYLRSLERTPIGFKYLDLIFDWKAFVSVDGLALQIILSGKCRIVNISGIKELLYFDEENNIKCYDGDVFNGEFVNINTVSSMT